MQKKSVERPWKDFCSSTRFFREIKKESSRISAKAVSEERREVERGPPQSEGRENFSLSAGAEKMLKLQPISWAQQEEAIKQSDVGSDFLKNVSFISQLAAFQTHRPGSLAENSGRHN